MWIARDRDGDLYMYESEPIYDCGIWMNTKGANCNLQDCELFNFVLEGEKIELAIKGKESSPNSLKEISKSLKELNQILKRIEKKIK